VLIVLIVLIALDVAHPTQSTDRTADRLSPFRPSTSIALGW
jgi:hypothetical protein